MRTTRYRRTTPPFDVPPGVCVPSVKRTEVSSLKIIPAEPGWYVKAYENDRPEEPDYFPVIAWQFRTHAQQGTLGEPLVLYSA